MIPTRRNSLYADSIAWPSTLEAPKILDQPPCFFNQSCRSLISLIRALMTFSAVFRIWASVANLSAVYDIRLRLDGVQSSSDAGRRDSARMPLLSVLMALACPAGSLFRAFVLLAFVLLFHFFVFRSIDIGKSLQECHD